MSLVWGEVCGGVGGFFGFVRFYFCKGSTFVIKFIRYFWFGLGLDGWF